MAENDVETKIVSLLEKSPGGVQSEEIAAALSLTRHTISKYLEVLKAKDKVHFRKVGRTKLWKIASADIRTRPLMKGDVDSVLRIMVNIGRGAAGREEGTLSYLRETVERHIEREEPLMNLAAELDGRLVGFVIAEIRAWEFGQREKTGWIKVLGVEPEYQGKGIGKKLGQALLSNFEASGIARVRTLVNWYEGDLLSYFRILGFDTLNMIPLEAILTTGA
ncbi:MAG: GNAT family N-acetyltransferase [Candidatus Krumholzibacteria bacterium]|nr:GNAT family N-acetyltransferase [Candidatus Krumholzibacteria bacterium]